MQHNIGLANLLYYGDIVAMANSVENRSPFMDHRLVEMVFSSGFSLKVDNGRNKAALRKHPTYNTFQDILNRGKIGFASPIAWRIKNKMVDDLKGSRILDWHIFNRTILSKFLTSNAAMSAKYERFLFRLFQVYLWEQEFIAR